MKRAAAYIKKLKQPLPIWLLLLVFIFMARAEGTCLQISYEQSGGFAGLRSSLTVDTSTLPPDEADKVQAMVRNADFFNLPATLRSPRPQPDRYQYDIHIKEDGKEHSVNVSEEAIPPNLQPLVHWLKEETRRKARERRGK